MNKLVITILACLVAQFSFAYDRDDRYDRNDRGNDFGSGSGIREDQDRYLEKKAQGAQRRTQKQRGKDRSAKKQTQSNQKNKPRG